MTLLEEEVKNDWKRKKNKKGVSQILIDEKKSISKNKSE